MEKENLTRQKYVIQKLPLWALAHALWQKNRAIHTQGRRELHTAIHITCSGNQVVDFKGEAFIHAEQLFKDVHRSFMAVSKLWRAQLMISKAPGFAGGRMLI